MANTLRARLFRCRTEGHTEGGWSLVWPVFTGVESGLSQPYLGRNVVANVG